MFHSTFFVVAVRLITGHNRNHLTHAPYRCNMCPSTSHDKGALIRHMRTHNGERPYECRDCQYAFTTKANCERHLRNRHGKASREAVRASIVYHLSEDTAANRAAAENSGNDDDGYYARSGTALDLSADREDSNDEDSVSRLGIFFFFFFFFLDFNWTSTFEKLNFNLGSTTTTG